MTSAAERHAQDREEVLAAINARLSVSPRELRRILPHITRQRISNCCMELTIEGLVFQSGETGDRLYHARRFI